MRHLVVPSDGSVETDEVVRFASEVAGPDGALVLISVLAGSRVDRTLEPAERGRVRRRAEDEAKRAMAAQMARTGVEGRCHGVALFGDVVTDTLLLAGNLGADAVVIGARGSAVAALIEDSPIPVLVVPEGA